jgi:hypothetical protein
MLLADRYDDRTHFIFELLQNAEDALKRRGEWTGPRKVTFTLKKDALSLSHYGRPFDEANVRGICGIAESTKGVNSIGRFGIGFKSVYTFTDRPEIHSGLEDFAVENYVQPKSVPIAPREDDETLIVLPLDADDETAHDEITNGFRRLGAGALLFLRHIEEINWAVDGGATGVYLRSSPETLAPNVQRITVIGQESGKPEVDQVWLVFSREVFTDDDQPAGLVEVAFSLTQVKDKPDSWTVQPVSSSPLVVFFPTVVSTNLGFLVQGPYRTTPSRDNIPRNDPWNQYLVRETSAVLVEALRWMRDEKMLDTSTLRCLPLDREKFPEGSMFQPLFETVRQSLIREKLLPSHGYGYVSAGQAKLARTQDLRDLISPSQVTALFGEQAVAWLSGDITQDRAPEIRQYVMRELLITEITPALLVPRLTKPFLEAQSDEWILRLYEFLSGQEAALRRRLETVPLIRLDDGTHVVAKENGKAKAFLPSQIETDFPTVRRAVCGTPEVRSFLLSLGITEPDPVDDVVWNVLPKYLEDTVDVDDDEYASDIERIRAAFNTDSKIQREKLLSALRQTSFVMVVDSGDGEKYVSKPGDVYIATERLKSLFAGVPDVMMVDDEYSCLKGESLRELLEACGSLRYPRPIPVTGSLDWEAKKQLRINAGHEETSGQKDQVEDWHLKGLEELLATLPNLDPEERKNRARLLWESLGDLEERRGRGIFDGTYSWTHYGSYKTGFPAYFVRRLIAASWVPDAQGDLHPPGFVVFDSLGWKSNPFLLSKITFKPPIIEQLAKEAGLDPALLDLLKKHGITSEADLITRLGITKTEVGDTATDGGNEPDPDDGGDPTVDVYGDASDLWGDLPPIPPGTHDPTAGDDLPTGGGTGGNGKGGTRGGDGGKEPGTGGNKTGGGKGNGGDGKTPGPGGGKRTVGGTGGRPFISYVGTHQDEEEPDPDGLDQKARMQLEELAIQKILAEEPKLNRTPAYNPGFDLFENDELGRQVRWIEVKAMTGALADRPVGMSYTQFDWGQKHRAAFWLYVVEHAGSEDVRILRIQDPVGHTKTFTFDHGWEEIARTDPVL